MLRLSNVGLTGRSTAACVLLLLVTVGALGGVLTWTKYTDSVRHLTEHARVYTAAMSRAAGPDVLLNDRAALTHLAVAAVGDRAVELVEILDAQGTSLTEILGSPDSVHDPCVIDARRNPAPTRRRLSSVPVGPCGLLVTAPIWPSSDAPDLGLVEDTPVADGDAAGPKPLGYIRIVYSFEHLQDELNDHLTSSGLIAVAVILGGAALTVVMMSRVLTPVRRLVATTAGIAGGDLSRRAPEQAVGEMGLLARSFNHMADRLEATYASIEQKVADRTAELEREVAERRQAQQEIQRLSRQNALILDSAGEGIFGLDTEGRVAFINPAAARMIGREVDELIGALSHAVFQHTRVDGTPYPREECPNYAAFKDGAVHHVEDEVFWKKDGTSFPVEYTSTPIREDGKLTGAVVVFRDITERKQTADRLHEQATLLAAKNVELEARREQLLAQQEDLLTANRSLEAAKEAAEAGSRAKGEFLANISHELRTPMNGIMGMTELVLGTELAAEQRQHLETVMQCSESLLRLLNDILDCSKIEAGKMELDVVDFDLTSVIDGVVDLLGRRAVDKGLELISHVQAGVPPRLRGDPARLRQILVNLVGNAIKFTERGEVVVSVQGGDPSDHPGTLLFSVRDTGIGIPSDRQGIIFDSFTQADGATTRKYGGTGLGLAISKQLVELMGGSIWVESDVGRGSTFHFQVRLERGDSAPDRTVKPAASALAPEPMLGGRRVLIVDDNATNRRILQAILTASGCACESACGGTEALESLRAAAADGHPFDVVVLDIQMPGMDGYQVEQAIRGDAGYGQPRILLLSSIGAPQPRARGDGAFVYLSKPVKQSVLLATLGTMLGEQRSPENPPAPQPRLPVPDRRRARGRVLVVEDNAVNRKVVEGILTRRNYDVGTAENGRAAMELLTRKAFDLVLMDVQMPEMDGFEATRRIRADARLRGMPIVAMTAHAMKGDRERCLEHGMDDYLTKPVKADALEETVQKWLPGAKTQRKPVEPAVGQPPPAVDREDRPDSPLNLERALLQLGGDRELLDDAVDTFLANAPQALERLSAAIAAADGANVALAAHTLKGAASNICAEPTRRLAQQLELAGNSGTFETAASLLPALQARLDLLQGFVTSLREGQE